MATTTTVPIEIVGGGLDGETVSFGVGLPVGVVIVWQGRAYVVCRDGDGTRFLRFAGDR